MLFFFLTDKEETLSIFFRQMKLFSDFFLKRMHAADFFTFFSHFVECLELRSFLRIANKKYEFLEGSNFILQMSNIVNRLWRSAWITKCFLYPSWDIRKSHVSVVVKLLEAMLEIQNNTWWFSDSVSFSGLFEILIIWSCYNCWLKALWRQKLDDFWPISEDFLRLSIRSMP